MGQHRQPSRIALFPLGQMARVAATILLAIVAVREIECADNNPTGVLSAATLKYLLHTQPNARLDRLYNVSDNAEGMVRTYLQPAHQKAAKMIKVWMANAGMEAHIDAIANVRGRINGSSENTRRWITGSHYDAVPGGGKFDGMAGVALSVAAVEAVIAEAAVAKGLVSDSVLLQTLRGGKSLKSALPKGTDFGKLLNRSVEVIAFSEEEGIRFRYPLGSSQALVGAFLKNSLHRLEDADGISWMEALDDAGHFVKEKDIEALFIQPPEVEGYVEVHIEQHDELEKRDCPLGVVAGIAGNTHTLVTINGDLAYRHMGTVPMSQRRDPVVGVAEAIRKMERKCEGVANRTGEYLMCGTSFINIFPNNAVNIGQQVNFTIGVTAYNNTLRTEIMDYAVDMVTEVCERRGLACRSHTMMETKTVASPDLIQDALRRHTADALQMLPSMLNGADSAPTKSKGKRPMVPKLMTGMARDAQIMGQLHQYGLLHIRTHQGITHSPQEHVEKDDIAAAGLALYRFLTAQLLGPAPLDTLANAAPVSPDVAPENEMAVKLRQIAKNADITKAISVEELQQQLKVAEAIVPKMPTLSSEL